MSDIIIRISDGRVQDAADSVTATDDRYVLYTQGHRREAPFNSYAYPTQFIKSVTPPVDLIGGWNYNYVNGAFVSSGQMPPVPEPEPESPPS